MDHDSWAMALLVRSSKPRRLEVWASPSDSSYVNYILATNSVCESHQIDFRREKLPDFARCQVWPLGLGLCVPRP